MSSSEPPRPPVPPTRPTEPLAAPVAPRQARPAAVVEEPVVERVPPSALPPEDRWGNPWPAIVAVVVGLLAGGLLGYAIGHHDDTGSAARRASAPTATHTVTRTNTIVHPKVVVHTVTAKTVTQTPAPANAENEARRGEAESSLRRVERENTELRRQLEEA
ncbi:MAG: hypothetical protein ACYDHT_00350 [Solirubrobacteraceae bacterium]